MKYILEVKSKILYSRRLHFDGTILTYELFIFFFWSHNYPKENKQNDSYRKEGEFELCKCK